MKKHKPYSSTHYRQRSAQLFLLSVIASLVFFRPLVSHAEYGTFLQYIKVDFFECDDTTGSKKDKKIYLELNENSSVNLCYQVTNTYSEPLDVKVNFVDGWLSNGSRVCHSAAKKDLFGQYVQPNSDTLSLWAWESQKVTSKLSFPLWYVGQVMGCLMYNVIDKQAWWMFDVVVGRTRFIDVFVKWDLVIGLEVSKPEDEWSISNNKQLHVKKTANDEIVVSLQLDNKGNVAQDVLLKGEIKPLFGKPIEFTPQIKYVQWKESTIAAFSAVLPWYKGSFDISVSADYTPNFLFDSEQITPEMRKTQSVHFATSIFIFPWWIVAALLVLVALRRTMILLIKRHRKKRQAMMEQMQQMYQNMYAQQYRMQQPWMYPWWFLPNVANQMMQPPPNTIQPTNLSIQTNPQMAQSAQPIVNQPINNNLTNSQLWNTPPMTPWWVSGFQDPNTPIWW